MMKWILLAVAFLAIIIALTVLIGPRLPRDHVATVRASYRAAPSVIWSIISDPIHSGSWRKGLKSVDPLSSADGHMAWREVSASGTVDYAVTESIPERRLVTHITSPGLPYGGQWEYSLAPAGTGTELTITERGFVNPPLFRVMARLFFGFTSTLEAYHRSLAARLSETVAIEIITTGR
jgi:hypothetical protein